MVHAVTIDNFEAEVKASDKPVLVDFYADWCGPCKMTAPAVEALSEEMEGKIKVCKVDVDNNQQIAVELGIQSIPTLIVFKDGKIVDRVMGLSDLETLKTLVSKAL